MKMKTSRRANPTRFYRITAAVIRGLITATELTLFVLPTLYLGFGRKQAQLAPDIPSLGGHIPHEAIFLITQTISR